METREYVEGSKALKKAEVVKAEKKAKKKRDRVSSQRESKASDKD